MSEPRYLIEFSAGGNASCNHLQEALILIGDDDANLIDTTDWKVYTRKDFESLNQYLLME